MPAVGTEPIYELTINWDRGGQTWNNVLYYRAGSDPAPGTAWQELALAFAASVETSILSTIGDNVTLDSYDVRRLNNLFDFGTTPSGNAGGNVNEMLNDFTSVRIDKTRVSKETRDGWVKFSGLTEDQVNGNSLTAAAQTAWNTVADNLEVIISNGGFTFTPVIVGGKRPGGVGVPESDWIYQFTNPWILNTRVTPQKTRYSE